MEVPYGTLTDSELLNLPVFVLCDAGVMCLWITERVVELARKCLRNRGYECAQELIWVKTNQLQRLIRTGTLRIYYLNFQVVKDYFCKDQKGIHEFFNLLFFEAQGSIFTCFFCMHDNLSKCFTHSFGQISKIFCSAGQKSRIFVFAGPTCFKIF